MKTIKGLKTWITRTLNKTVDTSFLWANVGKRFTSGDEDSLLEYCSEKGFSFVIVISGTNQLRPQRTWFGLPEWVRSNADTRRLYECENTFCFIGVSAGDRQPRESLFRSAKEVEKEIPTCKVNVWVNREGKLELL